MLTLHFRTGVLMTPSALTFILLLLTVIAMSSCTSQHNASDVQGDTLSLNHATLLTIIQRQDSVCIVNIADPWKERRILHTYALVSRNTVPKNIPPQATVVQVPLQRAVIFTSVHLALIEELGCLRQVAGVCDKQYINLKAAQALPDFGSSMAPNIEHLVSAAPDALLVSPFENGGYGQMEKLGLPIIECADYMEISPLARAEWMRFYALLFGVDATELFNDVELRYNNLKRTSTGRSLFTEQLSGQAWYVPGGHSYLGQLFADAGSEYIFASNEEKGSVALSFETVFASARHANVWLVKYNDKNDLTLSMMAQSYPPYREFDAFKQGNVYGCNTGRVNYYEDICFHPERLLQDIETVLDGGDGIYYQRLKP